MPVLNHRLDADGLLARFARTEGNQAIKMLRAQGFKYGQGDAGFGLYSPTWDRQLGEWYGAELLLNPSVLYLLEVP